LGVCAASLGTLPRPGTMDDVFSEGAILQEIASFLTRGWTRAWLSALHLDAVARRAVTRVSWGMRLVALTQEGAGTCQTRLHEYRLSADGDSGWTVLCDTVPECIEVLAADGQHFYALGAQTRAWRVVGEEWRELPPRPPQHGPEAAVAQGRLMVLGGFDEHRTGVLTGRVSVYCPTSNTWTSMHPMPTERASRYSCAAVGNEVVVSGGLGYLGVLASADALDLSAPAGRQPWRPLPVMGCPRFQSSAVSDDSGRFVAVGGQFEDKCEALDMSTATWAPLPALPFKDMWVKAAAAEGRVFAMGRCSAAVLGGPAWKPFPEVPGHRVISLCATLTKPEGMEVAG